MDNSLVRAFWRCGDDQIIEFAMQRSRLNKNERCILTLCLDECMTQEEAAEKMDISTRTAQELWRTASQKLLGIPWVLAYAKSLKDK